MRLPKHFLMRILPVALGVTCFCSTASAAGTISGAQITGLYINTAYNMVFISTNLPKTGSPACSYYNSPGTNEFVLPLGTTLQNETYALLLSARATGGTVTLTGSGLCDTYVDSETLQLVTY